MTSCPTHAQLGELLAESLEESEVAEVAAHVDACVHCQQALEDLLRRDAPKGLGAADTPRFEAATLQATFLRRLRGAQETPGSGPSSHESVKSDSPHAPTPDRRPNLPGYEIVEEVGRGGMGVVYRAKDLSLQRVVAIKCLQASHPEARKRFHAEAEAAARLHHPNIVEIYEIGDGADGPYLALEFVTGASLAVFANSQPQPPREAARLVATLAHAMHYAHQQGVVHRDLKPSNVLLQKDERGRMNDENSPPGSSFNLHPSTLKITDFGLAKCLDHASGLTRSGEVVGTPSYMAPEQVEPRRAGKSVGPAADIWGLGAILYELLTGRPPFRGETPLDTMVQVRHEEPITARRLSPSVPRDLEIICLKCLQKEPHRRYHDAGALAGDLERHLDGRPINARPVGRMERCWRWMRRNPVVSALLAALATALVAGFAGVTWGWQRALDREAEARHEREVANESVRQAVRAVNEFYLRVESDKLLSRAGFSALRNELLTSAQKYYANLRSLRSQDPALHAELAQCAFNLALITEQIGSREEAVESYQIAVAAIRKLVDEDPARSDLRELLGKAYISLANMQSQLGRSQQAIEFGVRGRDIFDQLARDSDRPDDWYNLGRCWDRLGRVYQATEEHDQEAEEAFAKARTLQEKLVRDQPDQNKFRRELGQVYRHHAVLELKRGRKSEALDFCRMAIAIETTFLSREPEDCNVQYSLAQSYGFRANAERALGRLAEAVESNEQCIKIMEPLCRADPSITAWRSVIASALVNRAMVYRQMGDTANARTDMERAREHLDAILKTDSARIADLDTFVKYWYHLGQLQNATGDFASARDSFRQACEIKEKSLARQGGIEVRGPTAPVLRTLDSLSDMYNWRAAMELKLDGASNAIVCHQRARELLEKVLGVKPDNSWVRHNLGGHWHNEGNALKLLGRREEAIAAYQRAIVEQRRAFEQIPDNSDCRQFLTNHYTNLARVQRELGRPAEACAAIVEASRLWPNDPKRLYDFAAELTLTATLIGEERAERSGYLDQAFALLRQAVARGYKDARQLQENQALAELRKRPEFQELLTGLSNSDR